MDDFVIDFSGYGDFKVYYLDFTKNNNSAYVPITSGTKYGNAFNKVVLNVDIQGKVDEQNIYGIVAQIGYNNIFNVENVYYLYYKDFFGRLELGNLLSSVDQLRIGADSLNVGNGGNVNNDFTKVLVNGIKNVSNNTKQISIIANEGVLSSQMFGYISQNNDLDAIDKFTYKTKINYYTPDIYGLQLFGSYTFDNKIYDIQIDKDITTNNANINSTLKDRYINIGDIVSYGVNYINTFDNIGVGLSYVGEMNIKNLFNSTNTREGKDIDIMSNIVGVNINYFGLTFGTAFGKMTRKINKKSLENNINDSTFGDFFYNGLRTHFLTDLEVQYKSFSVGYEISNFLVSGNYFISNTKDKFDTSKYTVNNADEFNREYEYKSISVMAEYKLNKNASVYGEYIKFDLEEKISQTILKGNMFSLGLSIMFY